MLYIRILGILIKRDGSFSEQVRKRGGSFLDLQCFSFLQEWLESEDRKPLVIRGARQVGKT
ncbi:MAG: hypothetical protein V4489_08975 [Chlamydiota bacterium]